MVNELTKAAFEVLNNKKYSIEIKAEKLENLINVSLLLVKTHPSLIMSPWKKETSDQKCDYLNQSLLLYAYQTDNDLDLFELLIKYYIKLMQMKSFKNNEVYDGYCDALCMMNNQNHKSLSKLLLNGYCDALYLASKENDLELFILLLHKHDSIRFNYDIKDICVIGKSSNISSFSGDPKQGFLTIVLERVISEKLDPSYAELLLYYVHPPKTVSVPFDKTYYVKQQLGYDYYGGENIFTRQVKTMRKDKDYCSSLIENSSNYVPIVDAAIKIYEAISLFYRQDFSGMLVNISCAIKIDDEFFTKFLKDHVQRAILQSSDQTRGFRRDTTDYCYLKRMIRMYAFNMAHPSNEKKRNIQTIINFCMMWWDTWLPTKYRVKLKNLCLRLSKSYSVS